MLLCFQRSDVDVQYCAEGSLGCFIVGAEGLQVFKV